MNTFRSGSRQDQVTAPAVVVLNISRAAPSRPRRFSGSDPLPRTGKRLVRISVLISGLDLETTGQAMTEISTPTRKKDRNSSRLAERSRVAMFWETFPVKSPPARITTAREKLPQMRRQNRGD